jgi:predicted dehydrogenase
VVVLKRNGEKMFIEAGRMQTNEAGGQTASGVIDEWVDALLNGRKNAIPGEEGARSLAAIMACVESAKRKKHVRPAKI